jgi:hypothetical protein
MKGQNMKVSNIIKWGWILWAEENISKELTREQRTGQVNSSSICSVTN